MNTNDLVLLIENDVWMMNILRIVSNLNLPDWWIGAGFVRSKVWDTLHDYNKRTYLPDIDVVYFNKADFAKPETNSVSTKIEEFYQRKLTKKASDVNWSVTNQARMHIFHNTEQYKNSCEAIADWVETATCIAIKLDCSDHIQICSPYGTDDLFKMIVRPTPKYEGSEVFEKRCELKKWKLKWPHIKIIK
jgi:hypothetical protein